MLNVLFLCTGNSARSILAEAILSRVGEGRFRSFSAGSRPKGEPNPHALKLLSENGYDISGFSSKSQDVFSEPDAAKMDIIITVCDSAAGEACPVWPGHPAAGHWGIPDPAGIEDETEARIAFLETYMRMSDRIGRFCAAPVEDLGPAELKSLLSDIGGYPGHTDGAPAK